MESSSKPAKRAPSVVLLVSSRAERRAQMLRSCRTALPDCQVETLNEFADLVHRLAGNGVAMVLLDLAGLPELDEAAVLVLRGLGPHARLVAMQDDERTASRPKLMVSDTVQFNQLGPWLGTLGRSNGT